MSLLAYLDHPIRSSGERAGFFGLLFENLKASRARQADELLATQLACRDDAELADLGLTRRALDGRPRRYGVL
jgi:hypothetical protein